ncbi:MAG: DUF3644 domain-containing protein [Myxococcales bacterium]|nr:DUF3644 domain-containing protein [Myxococcales bacterium]
MTRATRENLETLHAALHEKSGQEVTLAWLAERSGYAEKTLQTYVTKNMLAPHVLRSSKTTCHVLPNLSLSIGELRRCLSQRANRYTWEHLGVTELVSSLLDRSRTNAGLALELINRPEMANRLDAFVLLFVTAWEQLLKADLEHREQGSIFTGATSPMGRQITIGLPTALERAFPSRTEPVRRNIEVLKDLRDGAAHLLVPEVTGIASRYFQASILNYIKHFQGLAEEPPFRFEGTGLLTLGVAYESPHLELLRVRHGQTASEVKALIEKLEADAQAAGNQQFAVSIEYQLVLDKKAGPNAIRLVNADDGTPAAVVKVPRDPKAVCPYSTKEVATLLAQRTGDASWNQNHVAAVAEYLGVKLSDNEYHYGYRAGANVLHTYSDSFVNKLCERLKSEPDLVKNAYAARRKPR